MADFCKEVRWEGADFFVWYHITPGSRPTWDDPGYAAEIAIVSVEHKNVEMIELLSDSTLQFLADEVLEDADEVLRDYDQERRCGLN